MEHEKHCAEHCRCGCYLSVDETVRRYMEASARFREEIKDNPEKARAFLLRAGIVVPSDTAPSGVELAPQYRPPEG